MPILYYPGRINEVAARASAALVAAGLTAALALDLRWAVPVFALGFVARAGWGPRFSLLARVAGMLAKRLSVAPKQVPGAPKQFAQAIGATLTIGASALFALGASAVGWVLVGMVATFATLEASVGFCAGCWMYGRLVRFGVIEAAACPECADLRFTAPAPERSVRD